jgi:hypothetical protein
LHKRGIQTSPDGKNYIQLACDYWISNYQKHPVTKFLK